MNKLLDFLNPINGIDEYLFFDPIYDQIQHARKSDDATLSQGVWSKDLKKSEWENVEELCKLTLKEKSKDLQVAFWLWEAWSHLYEDGFSDGVCLLALLLKNFDLHPYDKIHQQHIFEWGDQTLAYYLLSADIHPSIESFQAMWCELCCYYPFPKINEQIEKHKKKVDIKHQEKQNQSPVKTQENMMTEEIAFEIIIQIKDFLKQTQPQSLIPLILEIALSWQHKTLLNILEELQENKSCHQKLMKFLYNSN
jgi:hypothetical protein